MQWASSTANATRRLHRCRTSICGWLRPSARASTAGEGLITQLDLPTAFRRQTGMQTSRSNAPPLQLQNLILHQGHQRRDHHHQSPADQRREDNKGIATAR